MPAHIACPACQKIFFKISNMSDSNCYKNSVLKNQSVEKRAKKSNSPELEKLLLENDRLENENRDLKHEIIYITKENEELNRQLNTVEKKFYQDFDKLQGQIRLNEKQLLDGSKKCLDQQKKYAEEIKKIKQENENLNNLQQKEKQSTIENLKSLESEIKLLKLENESLKKQSEDITQKTLRYKTKLKHAVKIVNELNNLVIHYHNKPEIHCEMTQTDYKLVGTKDNSLDCSQCGDSKYKKNSNSESLLLSDIFFKTKSFGGSELDLFNVKSKC